MEHFESPATRSSSLWLDLILWVWVSGLAARLVRGRCYRDLWQWDSHRLVLWQLIRTSCLSSARQLDVRPCISGIARVSLTPTPRESRVRWWNEMGRRKKYLENKDFPISKTTLIYQFVFRERQRDRASEQGDGRGMKGDSGSALLGSRSRRDLSVFPSGPYYYC